MRSVLSFMMLCFGYYGMHAQIKGLQTTYTLEDCIRLALENNTNVRLASAQTQAAKAYELQALGSYLPAAEVRASYNRQLTNVNNGQFSLVNGILVQGAPRPNTYSLNAVGSWLVYNGSRREAQYEQATLGTEAAFNDLRIARMNAITNITRQYYAVLRAQQILQTRREATQLSQATLDRVHGLVDAGRSSIIELYSQEAEAANQEVSVLQAELDVTRATSTLLTTMGVEADVPATFADGVVATNIGPEDIDTYRSGIGSEEQGITKALQTRPDILAADIRTDAADAGIESARAGYYPTLSLNGGYSWSYFDVDRFDLQSQTYLGMSLRIPLFDQFQTRYSVENATFNFTQSQIDREKLIQQVRSGYRLALATLNNTERGLKITETAIKAAQINYEATRERFNVGSATLLDVQTANNKLVTARINRVTAVYDYYDARAVVDLTIGNVKER